MNKNKDPNWITENGNENQGENGKKGKGGGGEGGGGGGGGDNKNSNNQQPPKDNKPKGPAIPVSTATCIHMIPRLQVLGKQQRFLQDEMLCWLCISLLAV